MLFSKTLLVLLLAILGTSWLPDGRNNGLASAWFWNTKTKIQIECVKNNVSTGVTTEVPKEVIKGGTAKVLTIGEIPQEDDEFAPLTAGIWVANEYYRLPNAPFYKVEIKEGTARSFTHVPNPYYRGGSIIIKD
ncbi:GSCOCT00013046001.2-RA-CDS [Cotesia congregata]|uniref:Cc_bv16.1_5.2 n=2 Tax=root TaxID=1 RepID=S6D2T5_COTCN|nr:hypothetical protein CcBV_5.2 [Bracoviriform congregatae]CAD6243368.1 GSCOCT00013046001.2-RA-CDS [Cotesia congregata]CAG17408.1 hypothetical protein CcBV_5.2 [Bracoviriform congregatae]CAG5092353.1 cc_bv16.1_5.2 [Cotesia congregata]CCQ71103.1 hypothetical protein BV16-1 [Cotesia congregata]